MEFNSYYFMPFTKIMFCAETEVGLKERDKVLATLLMRNTMGDWPAMAPVGRLTHFTQFYTHGLMLLQSADTPWLHVLHLDGPSR